MAAVLLFSAMSGHAFDLKSALKNAAGSTANSDAAAGNNGIGGLLGGLSGILGQTDVTLADLEGTWKYSKPAVAFKSDNMLKKAGGAAASAAIESKLAPYYQKAGLTAMEMTFNADSTFTMMLNRVNLSGNLEKDDEGNFVFKFKALGQVNIGRSTAVITKSGNSIEVTFDASKLVTLVSKVAAVSGNTTVQSVSKLLESYDGLNAGFQLTKKE